LHVGQVEPAEFSSTDTAWSVVVGWLVMVMGLLLDVMRQRF